MKSTMLAMVILMMVCLYHKAISASAPFQIRATILQGVTISESQKITFPNQSTSSNTHTETVSPSQGEELSISSGGANNDVQVALLEDTVNLSCVDGECQPGDTLTVDHIAYNDAVDERGNVLLDEHGNASHIAIGASEETSADTQPGTYQGDSNLQIAYA